MRTAKTLIRQGTSESSLGTHIICFCHAQVQVGILDMHIVWLIVQYIALKTSIADPRYLSILDTVF